MNEREARRKGNVDGGEKEKDTMHADRYSIPQNTEATYIRQTPIFNADDSSRGNDKFR